MKVWVKIREIENCPPDTRSKYGKYYVSRTKLGGEPPSDLTYDLKSRFEKGIKLKPAQNECCHYGISMTDSMEAAEALMKNFPPIINMAQIEITEDSGIISPTLKKYHHTWWPYDHCDRASLVVKDGVFNT